MKNEGAGEDWRNRGRTGEVGEDWRRSRED